MLLHHTCIYLLALATFSHAGIVSPFQRNQELGTSLNSRQRASLAAAQRSFTFSKSRSLALSKSRSSARSRAKSRSKSRSKALAKSRASASKSRASAASAAAAAPTLAKSVNGACWPLLQLDWKAEATTEPQTTVDGAVEACSESCATSKFVALYSGEEPTVACYCLTSQKAGQLGKPVERRNKHKYCGGPDNLVGGIVDDAQYVNVFNVV